MNITFNSDSIPGRKTFFITFGQASPMRDHWVEIEAENEVDVRMYGSQEYNHWCGVYTKETFCPHFFPSGKIGGTIKLQRKDQTQ